MTSAVRHLGDVLAYAATKHRHDAIDRSVVASLAVPPADLGLPGSVEVRWLGVAGFALTCEGTTVLVDPYVTRLSSADFLRRRVIGPDRALIDRFIGRADAILLGHTHFDHALDTPSIAARDGATVYGGASATRLMALHGLASQAVEVAPHQPYEIGPFTVSFVPSQHAKLLLGKRVPSGGEITCEHVGHLTPQAYCCGQVWGIRIEVAGATIYHQGSADLIEDEVPTGGVDVFLCGVAGRQFTEHYTRRILTRLQPETVVVTHHDDFFRPLDGEQGLAFGVNVEAFTQEVADVSSDLRVATLTTM